MPTSQTGFITVVSGLPRSGTSMAMGMLEHGGLPIMSDGFRKADEDNPLGYYEFEAVKRLEHDTSWLPHAYDKAIKVIYIFLQHLPAEHPYKLIFMRRSLDEVIASQKVMLTRRGQEGRLNDQQLMSSYNDQLQRLYAWLRRQENFSTLYLDYSEVLREPEKAVLEIAGFVGLPLDTRAMLETVDPTLHRNRIEILSSTSGRGNE